MSKRGAAPVIRLRGVRHNNLKNFNLDLPLRQLIVITGLSGSGKSSLAFDTLFAEGQRRYIETFSPYARQFFERMDKPQVDSIEGIPPAIAIEQRNTVRTTRSTVGTMTEICDYAKLIWFHLGQLHCRGCGQPVQKDSPQFVWNALRGSGSAAVVITFELPLTEKISIEETFALISRQGYQRVIADGGVVRIEEALARFKETPPASIEVIQDRVTLSPANRSRFIETCEQAYHFGKGRLRVCPVANGGMLDAARTRRFSNHRHCAACDIDYREPSAALFSFNHPLGACPACRGFGRTIAIDYNRAVPDRSRTLAQGAVKPWQTGQGAESQQDLMKFCRKRRVPVDVPVRDLPREMQDWLLYGDPDYGKDSDHQWPRAWYGVKGYFDWLESKSYKMHVRVLLSRYRAYRKCAACDGQRFQPDTLLFKLGHASGREPTIADFYRLPIRDASAFIHSLFAARSGAKANDPVKLVLSEVSSRLDYLNEVGLGYLTLDRPTRSLSGGETERVNLTTCLGSGLVNTLFVLDEPSVGLHARDTDRLVRIVQRLRDAGNTVVVVEHEASVMRAADQIVDLGPGHGESGGQVVFQGPYAGILKSKQSLTGRYLSGRQQIEPPPRRPVDLTNGEKLVIRNATLHNLQNLTVEIPVGRFVCVTGVSGSGKTTLVRDVLLPLLSAENRLEEPPSKSDDDDDRDNLDGQGANAASLEVPASGADRLQRAIMVDQSPIGKTPRSNPAVYVGAFDDIREIFARTEAAQQRGLGASAFSFNSPQGQCERCRGAGFEKIEMQFLSDVFIRCPDCNGRRYRAHILEVRLELSPRAWTIADVLEATVDEACEVLEYNETRSAVRAVERLQLLQEVGLGYLRLGQPINTLSGGESQRLKLVSHLAENLRGGAGESSGPTLFLFDEPTTGLHFDDVRVLLKVFQRLVDAGHSVLVIEHNLDVIRAADWLIDLGPEAGDEGGRLVAQGTPEEVARCPGSHTGRALHGQ